MGGIVKSVVGAIFGGASNATADMSGIDAQTRAIKEASERQAQATLAAAQSQKQAADAAAQAQAQQAQQSAQAAAQSQMQSINQQQLNAKAAADAQDAAAKTAAENTVKVDTTANSEDEPDNAALRRRYFQQAQASQATKGGSGITLS
ncbi:hypothetical protein [Burkholderia cenocepacia]|uniref:Uncharacterized protein n=1 Tax=Burkholderia phage Paku TaxID=2859650 RepID=A0AAE7WMR4_9CAUD|nr:hypothetical protein [Burkholderia cenocepacia]ELK7725623.1 hypothetical protein [Burkholderia cenocepacia]QYW02331.1 hypothetical protein CPT_Paku_037 [Burkholderia phage Paku]